MKALSRQRSECAEIAASIFSEEPMCVVFYHRHAVTLGDLEDCIHLATDARVVNHHDCTSSRRDQLLGSALVEIQGVRSDVGENRAGAADNKSIDCGDEGIGGHDDFVAGFYVEQEGHHLEGVSARGCEECLRCPQLLLQVHTTL